MSCLCERLVLSMAHTSFDVSIAGKLLSKSPMSLWDCAGCASWKSPPRRSSSSWTVALLSAAELNWSASSPRMARSRERKSEGSDDSRASKLASPPLTSVWPGLGSAVGVAGVVEVLYVDCTSVDLIQRWEPVSHVDGVVKLECGWLEYSAVD